VKLNEGRSFSKTYDQGFSLVEIVVAIFILAALSLALIPALVVGVQQSKNNAVIAAATEMLTSRLDDSRGQTASCQALTAFAASTVADQIESHGVSLHLQQILDSCPSTYPGTVRYTVTVVRTDTGAVLATASSLIYLQSAS
jgi:prepilin-type N-terminal cleavage/methylation domain-containing protein